MDGIFLTSIENSGEMIMIEKLDSNSCSVEALAKVIIEIKKHYKDLLKFNLGDQ